MDLKTKLNDSMLRTVWESTARITFECIYNSSNLDTARETVYEQAHVAVRASISRFANNSVKVSINSKLKEYEF